MSPSKINLYKISLCISMAITIIGALFKIQHWTGGTRILSIGLAIGLIYIVIALIEIFKTKSTIEKILWLPGFIVFGWIAGLVFYYREIKAELLKG